MKSEHPKKTTRKAVAPRHSKAAPASPSNLPPKAMPALVIPSILLEGDAPSAPPPSGPGRRYALGESQALEDWAKGAEEGELPEAYGTERLYVNARDPHWLYAYWDLTRQQLRRYNSLSADRHLVLRIYEQAPGGKLHCEIHVHPESRTWLVNVDRAGTTYIAELGYYSREGRHWVPISTSSKTFAPAERMSDDVSLRFETFPHFKHLQRPGDTARSESATPPEMPARPGTAALPKRTSAPAWTDAQERALAELVAMDLVRHQWTGSPEIPELLRQQFHQDLYSAVAAQFSLPGSWSGAISSISSPAGGMERRKKFWFKINAELIIYGATEPDARVRIGDRLVELRTDGTFSYRFALPNGEYQLATVATSADGTDSRSADLKFSRSTQYRGEVGEHPQEPELKTPAADHVA